MRKYRQKSAIRAAFGFLLDRLFLFFLRLFLFVSHKPFLTSVLFKVFLLLFKGIEMNGKTLDPTYETLQDGGKISLAAKSEMQWRFPLRRYA